MMARTLAAVARAVGGRLDGPDATYANVTIDSRTVSTGDLFVAIEGRRADGHEFVGDAAARGAAGAIVSRIVAAPLAQIETRETVAALGALARAWREGFEIPVVAVTGSNGKTTVKELVATILRERGSVCWSEASLNNHLGVPLTLLRLTAAHDVLVAELGANHPGEIDYLAGLVSPTVGVITNANACHLDGFGSIGGVATAKGELLDHLPRAGTAVLNADDDYFTDWRARSHAETVCSFGFSAQADCTVRGAITSTPAGSGFSIVLPGGETCDVELPLKGRHNVINALAAAAAATALGATAGDVVAGLANAHGARRARLSAGLRGHAHRGPRRHG
jgi:UDP-N-acetylmuramoyl-tripeptide--D-alanyl-D-alanine ligase